MDLYWIYIVYTMVFDLYVRVAQNASCWGVGVLYWSSNALLLGFYLVTA